MSHAYIFIHHYMSFSTKCNSNYVIADGFRLFHKFTTGPVMMLDCKIQLLPKCGVPLIAAAGDDGFIHLFHFQLIEGELGCVKSPMKISGHDDWVRTLAFTVEGDELIFCILLIFFLQPYMK